MHFFDERVRETMTPLGGGAFRLEGAVQGRQTFAAAKRPDGSDVQSGDTTTVCLVQKVSGATVAAVVAAALTLGGTNTLTADVSKLRMSTSGGALPTFATNQTGEAFITWAVDDIAGLLDPYTGKLINKLLFRNNILLPTLTALASETSMRDGEAAFVLGAAVEADGLAGAFVQDDAASGTIDNVDIASNPNASGGRMKRAGLKVAPTSRGNTIGAGGVLDILTANIPGGEWDIVAWQDNDASNVLRGAVQGHATDPIIYGRIVRGGLDFALNGATIRLRNTLGVAAAFSYVIERRG